MKYANKKMKQNQGFTLLELLVSMSIVSVMIAMALPNVSETIKNAKLSSSSDNLYSLIRYARAEAVRRGTPVFVGASDGLNWSSGAVVWTETDGNSVFNTADTLIRRTYVIGKVTIAEQNNNKVIAFNGQGYTPAAIQLSIFDSRGTAKGKTINVLVSGFSAMKKNGGY